MNVPGLLAMESIEQGEELMCVPERFHIAAPTVAQFAPALRDMVVGLQDVPASRHGEVSSAASPRGVCFHPISVLTSFFCA